MDGQKAKLKIDWVNTVFIAVAHILALSAIPYMVFVKFSWWTVGLGFLWFACCGLAITGSFAR